jgi:hypothetical protein
MGTWSVAATAASVVILVLLVVPLLFARASATGRLGRWESRAARWAATWPERHPWPARNGWWFLLLLPLVWVGIGIADFAQGNPITGTTAIAQSIVWTILTLQWRWRAKQRAR